MTKKSRCGTEAQICMFSSEQLVHSHSVLWCFACWCDFSVYILCCCFVHG